MRVVSLPVGSLFNLEDMEVSSLTLAALATSAVPGLEVTQYSSPPAINVDELTTILDTNSGLLAISLPNSVAAEVRHSAELLSLSAVSKGLRTALSFHLPEIIGVIGFENTRAIVKSYLDGFPVTDYESGTIEELIPLFITAITEIHELPLNIVKDQGLLVETSTELKHKTLETLNTVFATGLLPDLVHDRWKNFLLDAAVWDFKTCVVHGDLEEDKFLVDQNANFSITGWAKFKVSDPAFDFSWLTPYDRVSDYLALYSAARKGINTETFFARARFWQEFAIAEYLLHGIKKHDETITEDASMMLAELTDFITSTGDVLLSKTEVSTDAGSALSSVPDGIEKFTDTAAYEALDEERVFTSEDDFSDVEATASAENILDAESSINTDESDDDNLTVPISNADQ